MAAFQVITEDKATIAHWDKDYSKQVIWTDDPEKLFRYKVHTEDMIPSVRGGKHMGYQPRGKKSVAVGDATYICLHGNCENLTAGGTMYCPDHWVYSTIAPQGGERL
jgi:hypothetical protein